MKIAWSDRWYWVIVAFVLILSLILRAKDITRPLLDAHYFRQTQTATVARNFYLSGIDFFHTKLDIFGDGKEQMLLLEFPFYQAAVTVFSYILGFHDYVGRLVALLFAALSGIFLVLLSNGLISDKKVSLAALIFFIFSPVNYYFQQAYMIESAVLFFHILSLYLWFKYAQSKSLYLRLTASVITAFAFVSKNVYAPFLLLPILGILYFKLGKKEFLKLSWLPGVLFAVLLLLIWQYRVDVSNLQNGHSNFTLGDTSQGLWNFGTLSDRFDINGWVLRLKFIQNSVTKYQWPVFLVGLMILLIKKFKSKHFLLFWLVSMFFYYLVLFRIQSHDYYFMLIMPVFSIIAAYGLVETVKLIFGRFNRVKQISFIIIAVYLFLFASKSIQNAGMYFRIDQSMVGRFKIYNSVMENPGNVIFVFPEYDWNSVYTYYTGRRGKVFAAKDITWDIISGHSKSGYHYAVVDGMDAVSTIKTKDFYTGGKYRQLYEDENILIMDIL